MQLMQLSGDKLRWRMHQILEELLQQATIWFVLNHLVLNESKTNSLIFETTAFNNQADPVKILGLNDVCICFGQNISMHHAVN